MAFDRTWLEHIPEPNLDSVENSPVRTIIELGRERLGSLQLDELFPGFVWSVLVGQEDAQLGQINAQYPYVARLAFGFADPDTDYFVDAPVLAVIVHVCPPTSPEESDDLEPVLGRLEGRQIFVGQDRTAFPVIPRVSVEEPQVGLSSPGSAMLAAWMRIRCNTNPKDGWLLPLHALSVGGGGLAVQYTDGSTGKVIDSLGSCMDAAVASSSNPPQHLRRCKAEIILPPGLPVDVADQNGTTRRQTLMDIDINLGLLRYQKAPIRLTYDWSSSTPGDSGALISHGLTGDPVAMHQGASWLRDPSGAKQVDGNNKPIRRAFGICLYQVAQQLDGDFYR